MKYLLIFCLLSLVGCATMKGQHNPGRFQPKCTTQTLTPLVVNGAAIGISTTNCL